MKWSNEVKTGATVIACALLLVVVLFKTGDLDFSRKGYTVTTRFFDSGGVKQFAPVRLSGMEIGQIQKLKIIYEENKTMIEVELWIESDVKLRADSTAMVANMGLMGEKYVEIRSGESDQFLAAGSMLASKEPITMDQLLAKGNVIADELTVTLQDFRKMTNNLNDVLVDAKPKVKNILTNLDGVLDVNRPKIDTILTNLEDTSEYFKEFAEDIKYHPWKVLAKGKEKSPKEIAALRAERKARKTSEAVEAAQAAQAATQAASSASSSGNSDPTKQSNKGFLIF